MSRAMLSPNYCSCTVLRARNLYDKGKADGINAFCTISMGKEKFATEVCEKTVSPDWHEQCDMAIVDDATIKLTVYHKHKSSLVKEDFVGRAFVSLRNLQDYDRVDTNWYKLTNREGQIDKDRGEIEVQLQFYSKNDTTGSVLDLATKKKHSSFKDIKHSLSSKLNIAKHRKDKYAEGNQLAEQRRKLGGDFLEEDSSETTSFTGSHLSLNSMQNNNNMDQQKKRSYTTNLSTPQSTHRSITSDYETSSILDSASMYGADEVSNSSATNSFQQEINIDEQIDKKKKKKKAPKPSESPKLPERTRSSTVVANVNNSKDYETDRSFGLSTIKETHDQPTDEEIDFGGYFDRIKKPKRTAPTMPSSSLSDDIQTPSISIQQNTDSSLNKTTKQDERDSTDDDVDELLGKLERMSSMRSSKRRIKPQVDGADESPSETDNKFFGGRNRSQTSALPDIVVDPKLTKTPKGQKKTETKPLNVLGYPNVQTAVVNPSVRQELQSLNHEELLQVIAFQNDLIKKRDTRLKDLENYTDSLLVKIVEQCPTILQVGYSTKKR